MSAGRKGRPDVKKKKKKASSPGSLHDALRSAVEYQRTGKFDKAEVMYRRILASVPDDADIHCNLGAALSAQGKLEDAEGILRRALHLQPGHIHALFNLANVVKELGRGGEAAALFEEVLGKDPRHRGAWFNLGNLCRDRQDIGEAKKCYQRVIAIDGSHAGALINLAHVLHEEGNTRDAIECCGQAITHDENNAAAHFNMGKLLRETGDIPGAIASYRRSAALDPADHRAFYSLGNIYKDAGRYDEAVTCFEKTLLLDPGNVMVPHLLAALRGERKGSAPPEYVRELYDRYAEGFDRHLTETLRYRIPSVLKELIGRVAGADGRFASTIDLGCGTGLAGVEFRPLSDRLTGIDISPGMIVKARKREIYDMLLVGDLLTHMEETTERYDLFLAADVLIYTGDLAPLFAAVHRSSLSGAWLGFSTERTDEGGFLLRKTGRFAHAPSYIETTAGDHGFDVVVRQAETIRMENDRPIHGDVFILRRRG
ncbi:MAG: tetratricopeptide repeat protein [Deltaproteobacteria bacterium]|nr:tetratricopeptide repeat protein [Deltaproteobacteria bacterium]